MKTAVTIINTIQTGMDSYNDYRITKVFTDDQSIRDIKEWIKFNQDLRIPVEDVSLACVDISDFDEK